MVLLAVEASDGFNRKVCVVCTNIRHLTQVVLVCFCCNCLQFSLMYVRVLYAGLLLKKQGKCPKPMYTHYIFLPDSIAALLLQHFSDQIC